MGSKVGLLLLIFGCGLCPVAMLAGSPKPAAVSAEQADAAVAGLESTRLSHPVEDQLVEVLLNLPWAMRRPRFVRLARTGKPSLSAMAAGQLVWRADPSVPWILEHEWRRWSHEELAGVMMELCDAELGAPVNPSLKVFLRQVVAEFGKSSHLRNDISFRRAGGFAAMLLARAGGRRSAVLVTETLRAVPDLPPLWIAANRLGTLPPDLVRTGTRLFAAATTPPPLRMAAAAVVSRHNRAAELFVVSEISKFLDEFANVDVLKMIGRYAYYHESEEQYWRFNEHYRYLTLAGDLRPASRKAILSRAMGMSNIFIWHFAGLVAADAEPALLTKLATHKNDQLYPQVMAYAAVRNPLMRARIEKWVGPVHLKKALDQLKTKRFIGLFGSLANDLLFASPYR